MKIIELKQELMGEYWTEGFHSKLVELGDDDKAQQIVESLEDDEIIYRVNHRTHQEDYISDYLEYLWDISPDSFWRHVKTTFNNVVGLLWSDNHFYIEILCDEVLPEDILFAIISFVTYSKDENNLDKQDLDLIGCILKKQIENNEIYPEILKAIELLPLELRQMTINRIDNQIEKVCDYV